MTVEVRINADDYDRLADLFAKLPEELRAKVARRAMGRVRQMGNTAIVRDIAALTKVPQRVVRSRVRTWSSGFDLETNVSSDWIKLMELGGWRLNKVLGETEAKAKRRFAKAGKQMKGSYRRAFLARIKRDRSVFRRVGSERGPVKELFGPNPAHAVLEAPDRYRELLGDVIQSYLLPRLIHEMLRALPD